MDKLINLEDAIEEIAKHDTTDGTVKVFSGREVIEMLKDLPSAQPKTQKLLDDGTLIVHTDFDMTKFDRVNVIQNGTHYGDLFYQDDDTRRSGKWIPHKSVFGGLGEKVYTCNRCGYNIGFHIENFCPNCGCRMEEGDSDDN